MKVLFTKKFFPQDLEYIKAKIDVRVEFINEDNFEQDRLIELAPQADVFFGGLINEELLTAATHLKFIQIPWTGVDNLNWELLAERNVTVCNSHSNAYVVAEHAVALMLDAAKKISWHDRNMRKGNWNRLFPNVTNAVSPFSASIKNSKIGILGFGAVGQSIYEMLSGFQCDVLAFNRTGNSECSGDRLTTYCSEKLREVADQLDVLFISVPLTEQTTGFVNKALFDELKPKCILVNVSRGKVVSEEDLYNALNVGSLGWAAIDTWYHYPSKDHPIAFPSKKYAFHELSNVTLSPHRAGYVDAGFPHLDDAILNLNRFVKGEGLINVLSGANRY